MPYTLREALAAFRRSPLLVVLSVMAIGFSLFVMGLFGLTAHNIRSAIERVEERVEVVGYLQDDLPAEQIRLAQSELSKLPEVLEVRYVSRTEALATAMRELPEFKEVFSDLESNPLPASLEIRLRPGHRTTIGVERVAKHLRAYPFMEDVRYGGDWVGRIVFLRRVAAGVALVIGGAFAAVAVITIGAAIRIAIFARREEISIMRLVGATNGFVRRPFLLEGLVSGVIGSAVAVGLTYGLYRFVDASFMRLIWLPPVWVAGGLAVGAALGFVASALALRRHLQTV